MHELKKTNMIRWECNTWKKNSDDLIEVYSPQGNKVVLNKHYQKIWLNIDNETSIGELWNKIKDNFKEWDKFKEMLDQLHYYRIIRIYDKEDEFDLLFG